MRVIPSAMAGIALTLAMATFSGCNDSTNPPGNGTPDVTIQIVARNGSNSFSPNPDTVTVGQKVAWHNAHNMTHSATASGGQFDTGNIAPGGTSDAITMSTAGSFGYHCTPHPDMTGTLVVIP